jgi:hypothetical protein
MMPSFFTWQWISTGLPSVLMAVVVGLVSVWAAMSRRHWFLRAAALSGVLSLTLLSPRYPHEYALTSLFQAVCVVGTVTFLRRRTERASWKDSTVASTVRCRRQFSLGDALLGFVVIAAILAFLARVPTRVWHAWPGMAFFAGWFLAITLVVYAFATDPCGDKVRRRRGKPLLSGWPRKALPIGCLVLAAMHAAILLIMAPGTAIYFGAINPRLREDWLPEPNGYDDLIRAAMPLAGAQLPRALDPLPTAQLRALLTPHQHLLDLARQGLSRECRVPLSYTQADLSRPLDPLRELACLFAVEGKLAEREGRTDKALGSYHDLLRLSRAIARGGLVIDCACGLGTEQMATDSVYKLRKQLSPEVCRQWLATLQSFEAEREPVEEIEYRESVWWEHEGGLTIRMVESTFQSLGKEFSLWSKAGDDFGRYQQTTMRLLICELALQVFRAEHDREADRLEELVPEVLPAVPLDPFTGQPLVYRPSANGPLLYSLGYDRHDDGGQPLENRSGDIRLDAQPQPAAEP